MNHNIEIINILIKKINKMPEFSFKDNMKMIEKKTMHIENGTLITMHEAHLMQNAWER